MKTKGWQKVFGFTFVQYVKTKSFIIGTIVMALIIALLAVGINILPGLLSGEEDIFGGAEQGDITVFSAVYIKDSAEILKDEDYSALQQAGLKLSQSDLGVTELIDKTAAAKNEALVTITPESVEDTVMGYTVKTYYSPETEGSAVDSLSAMVSQLVSYRNMVDLGVSPEDYQASQRFVSTSKIEAGKDEWNMIESAINYIVPMVVSLVLFIMIFAYGQTVAQSIATEKTSRVMELLLTSVRPLAVVIGKVLAMGLISLLQFVLMGAVGGIAFAASAPFGIGGQVMDMLNNAEMQVGQNAEIVEAINNTVGGFNALDLLLIFVTFILGFVFFALIAALVGASVSRMEDLAQAMQPYSLLGIVGFYLAYFPILGTLDSVETGAASTNPIQIFSYYFPLSSPFSLPSALLLGNLSTIEVLIAVLILAVFVALMAVIVARVYEFIILHTGSRLKFGEILKMAGRKNTAK
ncbi:MAG: ABC transporter permease [Oscillospiraceae bacterium]